MYSLLTTLLSYFGGRLILLYAALLGSATVLLVIALALWWRVRRQIGAADRSLRQALDEIEREHQVQ
jgi:hypothetical protein